MGGLGTAESHHHPETQPHQGCHWTSSTAMLTATWWQTAASCQSCCKAMPIVINRGVVSKLGMQTTANTIIFVKAVSSRINGECYTAAVGTNPRLRSGPVRALKHCQLGQSFIPFPTAEMTHGQCMAVQAARAGQSPYNAAVVKFAEALMSL